MSFKKRLATTISAAALAMAAGISNASPDHGHEQNPPSAIPMSAEQNIKMMAILKRQAKHLSEEISNDVNKTFGTNFAPLEVKLITEGVFYTRSLAKPRGTLLIGINELLNHTRKEMLGAVAHEYGHDFEDIHNSSIKKLEDLTVNASSNLDNVCSSQDYDNIKKLKATSKARKAGHPSNLYLGNSLELARSNLQHHEVNPDCQDDILDFLVAKIKLLSYSEDFSDKFAIAIGRGEGQKEFFERELGKRSEGLELATKTYDLLPHKPDIIRIANMEADLQRPRSELIAEIKDKFKNTLGQTKNAPSKSFVESAQKSKARVNSPNGAVR